MYPKDPSLVHPHQATPFFPQKPSTTSLLEEANVPSARQHRDSETRFRYTSPLERGSFRTPRSILHTMLHAFYNMSQYCISARRVGCTILHRRREPNTLRLCPLEVHFAVSSFHQAQSPFLLVWGSFETFSCLFYKAG